MTTDQLCQWLRENSAGIYRPARDAADLIDRLTRELAEAKARAVIPDGWKSEMSELEDLIAANEMTAMQVFTRFRAMLSSTPISTSLPDGWVAVPVEPTAEMIDAMRSDDWPSLSALECRSIYRAMLSARSDLKESSDVE